MEYLHCGYQPFSRRSRMLGEFIHHPQNAVHFDFQPFCHLSQFFITGEQY